MEEIQQHIDRLERNGFKHTIASYIADKLPMFKKWCESQDSNREFKWGTLDDTSGAKIKLVEKKYAELTEREKKYWMMMDILNKYKFTI